MIKTSVKRPFLVLVGVIMVIVLGVVAFTKMKTDLLPAMSIPYVEVITTYPGAAPEKVEADVTDVLENSLGTVTGVENVYSQSAENYSAITLEFADDTDMDSAMAKVSRKIEQLTLPENTGKPIVLELSADMMATMYVSVTKKDADIYELTKEVEDVVIPYLKRQDGVASVSATGDVEKSIEIRLDQEMIDKVNQKILKNVDESLAEAKEKITDSKSELDKAKLDISNGKSTLTQQQNQQSKELAKYTKQLNEALATQSAYESQVTSLEASITALKTEKKQYNKAYKETNDSIQKIAQAAPDNPMLPQNIEDAIANNGAKLEVLQTVLKMTGQEDAAKKLKLKTLKQLQNYKEKRIPEIDSDLRNRKTELAAANAVLENVKKTVKAAKDKYEEVEAGKITAAAAFGASSAELSAAENALKDSEKQIQEAEKSFEDSAKTARENANLDQLLEMDTLAQLLSAQNFDMPAGYISEDETQYLLKVGEEYQSFDELKNTVLCKIDGVGDIKLSDVAKVTMIDNAEESYASVDGKDAIVLAITKSSTAFTSEVSKKCNEALAQLKKDNKGLQFLNIMDQGDYIDIIVDSVFNNLIYGAILAIIVILIFLRDLRPTIVIGFSIPLSVLFAIVIMYFTDISFNVISLSGLALGIGMLVDNSIVSIENIYRLRGEGVPAARAAVMGAKQIAGAITASTLTTICVFLPILFTDGLTRKLMMDMCLTIAFSLIASLIVALTVVPAMSATLLRNDKAKEHRLFDSFANCYEKLLRFCLRFKIVPIVVSVALLAACIVKVGKTGIVIMPEMGSDQMSVSITLPEDTTNSEDYETAQSVLDQLSSVKGVDKIGAMSSDGSMAMLGISGTESGEIKNITYYVMLKEEYGHKNKQLAKKMEKILKGMDTLEDYSVSESNMDMSSMLASGLEVDISGDDLSTLLSISEDVMDMIQKIDGFEEISNGQENADEQISIIVDKNKAAKLGLTVAQVYAELSKGVTTEKDATILSVDGDNYQVTIVNENDKLSVNNILDHEFEVTTTDETGKSSTTSHKLSEFAKKETGASVATISRDNQTRYIAVNATTKEGYNTTLQTRELQKLIDKYDTPKGYTIEIAGESESTSEIVENMVLMMLLGGIFIYLIMVAQFQSLLSPFIVIFTIPLAFTGGFLGLMIADAQLSLMSLMGFLILMGVVVNNGIVFVDYTNQLRMDGMDKKEALVATGKTRMRPILMTALTTIMAMATTIFSKDIGADMSRDMSIVVVGGLIYATLMTLIIVPVLYDIFFRRDMKVIDVGED